MHDRQKPAGVLFRTIRVDSISPMLPFASHKNVTGTVLSLSKVTNLFAVLVNKKPGDIPVAAGFVSNPQWSNFNGPQLVLYN